MDAILITLSILISIVCTLLFSAFLVAALVRAILIISAIGAFPVYMALYGVEAFMRASGPHSSTFRFNLPESFVEKTKMNILASACLIESVFLVLIITETYLSAGSLRVAMLETYSMLHIVAGILLMLLLYGVIRISSKSKADDRPSWEKMNDLSIPSLWKNLTKDMEASK